MNKTYDLIVSIVIYKPKMALLQQTLDSLNKCKNLNIKIVLFDNSRKPLKEDSFVSKYPVDYIFHGSNVGYGRAHNRNIHKYLGLSRYFLVLNPDVFFEKGLLEQVFIKMEQDPSIGACIPKICHPEGNVQLINRRIPRPQDYLISFLSSKLNTDIFKTKKYRQYQLEDIDIKKPFVCPTISGCFMFFRNDVLRKLQGFDERYFLYLEDTDLSRRVSEISKVVVFSDLVAFHHWSRGAYKSPKLFMMFVRNLIRYFNKWGWVFDPRREQLNSKVEYYVPPTISQNSVLNPSQIFDTVN